MTSFTRKKKLNFSEFDKSFSLLYFVIFIIELLTHPMQGLSNLHFVAKPLLIISLLYYLYIKRFEIKMNSRRLLFWALSISLIGDTLILFETISNNNMLFIFGVLAFMIVLILYSIIFLQKRNNNLRSFKFLFTLMMYTIILFSVLWRSLDHMLIPVMLYALVILMMNYIASLRSFNVPKLSFNFVLIGTLLMLISNTLVVINKFYFPLSWSHVLIMSTYGLAQYFIIFGVLKQNNTVYNKFNI